MKISIKREQSQAGLSFAEREKFRPQVKNKLFLLLALLMTAATGAWATDYTTLAVGDVIKVGDTFTPTADGVFNDYGVFSGDTYTLMRADIDNDYNVTEKTDGAYYVFKFESVMFPYIHFEKAFAVTAISDGLEVTNIENIKGMLSYTLALHESAAPAATTYSVKMKDGTVDAKNWSIASGEKSATGDAADGLTGLSEGDAVTLTYTGRLKVKGVKATSDAAAASVPDGALSGVFSVSSTKKVYFSKGNLRYASSKWSFFDNQYDYYTSHSADAWDHFGWSTSATTYGMSTSTSSGAYSGDFVDWGATMGAGWFTLSSDEWTYLFNTRTTGGTVFGTSSARYAHATINTDGTGVNGMILFPDGVDIASTEVTTAGTVNGNSPYATKCTTAQWSALAAKGCVFLPAAGYRSGSSVSNAGSRGYYWSSSPYGTDGAYRLRFLSGNLLPADFNSRDYGANVRLVREVATSDAAAAGNSVDLSTLTADYEAQDGDVLTGTLGGNYKITIADGATVTLSGAVINGTNDSSWAGLTLAGDGTIILSGENTVKGFYEVYPGIFVPENKTLTIQGSGSLTASSNGWGAGIGVGYEIACGNITIEGGTVTARGGESAAGIGGGYNTSCGDISITGGTVIATGGNFAAGIGGGFRGSCGTVTITGGVTSVTATAGTKATNSIGAGRGGSCGTVTIGGNVGAITESPYTYQPSN